LKWPDIHTEPARDYNFGYIHVRDGKSRNARRNVTLADRVCEMLRTRRPPSTSFRLFSGVGGRPILVSTLDHERKRLREALKMPGDKVLRTAEGRPSAPPPFDYAHGPRFDSAQGR
jgi:hypothetical protein